MAIRRLFVVLVLVVSGLVLAAGAAGAVDYPPTTGAHVTSQGSNAAPTDGAAGLPFTGGNDTVLVWVGAAFVGAGALAVARTRRRRSHA